DESFRGVDGGPVGRLGDGGVGDVTQQGQIGGLGGVFLIIRLSRQGLHGSPRAAEYVQEVANGDRGGEQVEDAPLGGAAELGWVKLLPAVREVAADLGEKGAIARQQVVLVLPQQGQGRLQVKILGHCFLDHPVYLG